MLIQQFLEDLVIFHLINRNQIFFSNYLLLLCLGNTPAIIDETADILNAVSSIILSKTFDNGVICASEQAVIVMDSIYEQVKEEFIKRGTYFLKDHEEFSSIRSLLFPNGRINPEMAGKSVAYIAEKVGIKVPDECRLIVAEIESIGPSEVLSCEKLFPVLSMYKASNFEEAVSIAEGLIEFAGKGHTSCLYTNPQNKKNIKYFQNRINTVRMLINSPCNLIIFYQSYLLNKIKYFKL